MRLWTVVSDAAKSSKSALLRHRLGALLCERQAAHEANASETLPEAAAARRSSYLIAATIAAALIVAWAGLCVI